MAYDSNIPNMQGAIKASEIAIDRPQDIIKTVTGDSGIVATEQIIRALGGSLRRINYILFSDNVITWDGSNIKFGTLTNNSKITFRLLQTEDFINQYPTSGAGFVPPTTIDLVLQGSNSSDSPTAFNTVPLAPNTVLYLELDRNTILNSSGTSGIVTIQNAISGGSIVPGTTARTALMGAASGMPHLTSQISGNTQTFYIPIAMHHQWTDGVTTYDDLLWIPHGIRWVKNTQSTLGATITSQGVGLVPPGGIIPIMTNIPGSYAIPPYSTPIGTVDAFGWMRADGSIIPSGQTLSGPTPNLTTGVIIYGSTTAGLTGGSANSSGVGAHTHTFTSTTSVATTTHTHNMQHSHQWMYTDEVVLSTNYQTHSLTSANSTQGSFGSGGTRISYSLPSSAPSSGAYNLMGFDTGAVNSSFYTTGALNNSNGLITNTSGPSSPTTTVTGTTDSAGSTFSILPPYISAVYLIRVR